MKTRLFHWTLSWLIVLTACAPGRPDMESAIVERLRQSALPLESPEDLTPLIERAASARVVLLGESTHGTSEFYAWRADISKRLIREKGFRFIAVEGDWAAIYRLNRYVKGLPGAEKNARSIMSTFHRWPPWMWANEETLELVEWLRVHNLRRPMEERVGFYGMDVYGDDLALSTLLDKLEAMDEDLAREAREAYGAYVHLAGDGRRYGQALAHGQSFETHVRSAQTLLEERTAERLADQPAARFNILQSAKVVRNAEAHYRAMNQPGQNSWNPRADHFFLTVERLLEFYGEGAQGIAWAHNTHVGDARATPMAQRGERNLGMAARLALGRDQVWIAGFGTYQGEAVAGRFWGSPAEIMSLPPGGPGTLEALMGATGLTSALWIFEPADVLAPLNMTRGHRAVGVVYNPAHEFPGNYVPTRLVDRYDAFLFFRKTGALQPVIAPAPVP